DVDRFWINDARGHAERLDLLAPIWIGFADEDLRGAQRGGGQRAQRADRSGSGDEHGAAATDLGAFDTVECHRTRLYQCTLLVIDAVGQFVGIVVVDDRVFAHAAPGPRQADAAHSWAQ